MRKIFIVTLLSGVTLSGAAHADQEGWCAAYARDFADARATDKVLWQHKYDIAQKSCLEKVVSASPAAAVDTPKKVEVVATETPKKAEDMAGKMTEIPAVKPVAKAVAPAAVVPEKTKVSSGVPQVGSEEWNAYCAKKYTSFDANTGTYQSRTGVQRKCLYTG